MSTHTGKLSSWAKISIALTTGDTLHTMGHKAYVILIK